MSGSPDPEEARRPEDGADREFVPEPPVRPDEADPVDPADRSDRSEGSDAGEHPEPPQVPDVPEPPQAPETPDAPTDGGPARDGDDGQGDGSGESRVPQADDVPSVHAWADDNEVESTESIDVPDGIIDQVIGQDHAVTVVRKAVEQKRHVMMLGDPGTGKSMLAQAMAEMMPSEELQDILVYHNPEDEHAPRVRTVPAGKGKEIVNAQKREANKRNEQRQSLWMLLVFGIMGLALFYFISTNFQNIEVIFFGIIAVAMLMFAMRYVGQRDKAVIPKLLVGHQPGEIAPFEDATGAHAGALLGDVRHDPFQSGGLETPAHERVEPGAIHKAHQGVLFVDEINMLRQESQQSLLTALQEKQFPIMGQSERSSGAMVKTEAVPCGFILVAAGNLDAIPGMHPALRSRIRGYGYEVYMDSDMDDTPENRKKLVRFIAQEVKKDGKIPHFDRSGIVEIVREAQRRAGRQGKLTLRLRELGGLVRVAGDIAHEDAATYVTGDHVLKAKQIARSLEQQVVDRYIEKSKDYLTFRTTGEAVGQVNGLAVRGIGGQEGVGEPSGIVLPIVAEVTPAQKRDEGQIIATGKLGEIAKEAVQNVSAVVKKYTGTDITTHDVHIQFIGTYEGVEGDSASISVATAVISAMEDVPVDQQVAMTGSLSVRGTVLPVGGVTPKIEAAARAGVKKILIPKMNMNDVLVEEKYRKQVEIVPVETLKDVLAHALVGPDRDGLLAKLAKLVPKPKGEPGRAPGGEPVPG